MCPLSPADLLRYDLMLRGLQVHALSWVPFLCHYQTGIEIWCSLIEDDVTLTHTLHSHTRLRKVYAHVHIGRHHGVCDFLNQFCVGVGLDVTSVGWLACFSCFCNREHTHVLSHSPRLTFTRGFCGHILLCFGIMSLTKCGWPPWNLTCECDSARLLLIQWAKLPLACELIHICDCCYPWTRWSHAYLVKP